MGRIFTILVIEDDKLMGNGIASALSSRGHRVLVAKDADDGREQLRKAQFDLVINDPLGPAPEVAETVLVLDDEVGRPRSFATAGLGKPFSADELLDAVDRALA